MENPINYWYQKYISLKAEMDKMMKEAVEGTVTCYNLNRYLLISRLDESLKYGDKVRIIILPKEDEK